MAIKVPNAGRLAILQMAVNKQAQENAVLRLFQNNFTPTDTDTEGNYTEATFTGYAPITLIGANWSGAVSSPNDSLIAYALQTFTSSAGSQNQAVYGYYVTTLGSPTQLLWAEKFSDGPYTIVNSGDNIKVTPELDARSLA